jgi:copper homeostasis protein
VARLRGSGVAGVVFGCLTSDGDIDAERMRALVAAARPLSTTCHRAFDMARNPEGALEALVACGVDRVLTSGQRPTAIEGLPLLRRLVARAAGRIVVMACGELAPATVATVSRADVAELHFAAPRDIASAMRWRNPAIGMGATDVSREYRIIVTDAELVRAMIVAARSDVG